MTSTKTTEARAAHGRVHAQVSALNEEIKAHTGRWQKSGRQMSASENATLNALVTRADALMPEHDRLKARMRQAEADDSMEDQMHAMFGGNASLPNPVKDADPFAFANAPGYGGKAADRRWSAAALVTMKGADPRGRASKALAGAGVSYVPTVLDTTIVREGERPSLVRQLIPVQRLEGTDSFAWMQHTQTQNNAAPVAKGALKPKSDYTVTRREDRVRTIAHLSGPVNRADLEDAASLADFIDAEMRLGVLDATEEQIVAGDGLGENLAGFLNTPGTSVQPFAVDTLTSLRKALTRQQQARNTPSAWLLSPEDWETIELMREDGASGGYLLASGPIDRAAQRMWGLPVVITDTLTPGAALLGDFAGSARIYQREDVVLAWSDSIYRTDGQGGGSTDFSRNQMVWRAEERVGLAVLKPSAFTEVALTA